MSKWSIKESLLVDAASRLVALNETSILPLDVVQSLGLYMHFLSTGGTGIITPEACLRLSISNYGWGDSSIERIVKVVLEMYRDIFNDLLYSKI